MMRKIPTLIPGEAGYELQLQHDAAVLQKHGDLCTDALIELCSEDVLTPYLHTLRAGHFAEVSITHSYHSYFLTTSANTNLIVSYRFE